MNRSKDKNFPENIKLPSTSTPNILPRKSIHAASASPILKDRKVKSPVTKSRYEKENSNESNELEGSEEYENTFSESDDEERIHSYNERDRIYRDNKSNSSNSELINYTQSKLHYSHNSQQSHIYASESDKYKNISGTTPYNSKKFSQENLLQSESLYKQSYVLITIGVVLLAVMAVIFGKMSFTENNAPVLKYTSIEDLRNNYPSQLQDTWNALQSGINEVKIFNKPSVFLLLHKDEAEATVDHFLKSIGKYATFSLTGNCKTQPIILQSSDLDVEEMKADYGHLIKKYKPELEKRAVMIIKNLDEVPGEVAQAFHSMCDEYTPLVGRTVFFFTLNVENLHESQTDLQLVENVLKYKWNNLNDDIFYPLFTRISNMVLKVIPEKLEF